MTQSWAFWAFLSAVFAALTAIFGKIGVARIDPDLATLLRTVVILAVLGALVATRGALAGIGAIPAPSWVALTLSGLATGASWTCYYRALKLGDAARVAPVDKLSVVLVAIFGVAFLGERLSTRNWFGILLIAAGALLVASRR
jgi:transporter family protein